MWMLSYPVVSPAYAGTDGGQYATGTDGEYYGTATDGEYYGTDGEYYGTDGACALPPLAVVAFLLFSPPFVLSALVLLCWCAHPHSIRLCPPCFHTRLLSLPLICFPSLLSPSFSFISPLITRVQLMRRAVLVSTPGMVGMVLAMRWMAQAGTRMSTGIGTGTMVRRGKLAGMTALRHHSRRDHRPSLSSLSPLSHVSHLHVHLFFHLS